MKPLKEYSIPVRGLSQGRHEYRFFLDWRFFQEFKDSPVKQAGLNVACTLEKHSDHFVVEIGLEGTVHVPCDRCLAEIDLPVTAIQYLIVKYGENVEEEADVVYISREEPEWNAAQYLYEYSLLALPMRKTFACEELDPRPCDFEMLSRLDQEENEEPVQETNPVWEELRKTFGN